MKYCLCAFLILVKMHLKIHDFDIFVFTNVYSAIISHILQIAGFNILFNWLVVIFTVISSCICEQNIRYQIT